MNKFDRNEHVLVVDGYGKGKIIAKAIEAFLRTTEFDGDLEELSRDEVLEVEQDVRGQLLLPQKHRGAE